jgi:hypothetical protein
MIISEEKEVYCVDHLTVKARGILYTMEEITTTLATRVADVYWDAPGRQNISEVLSQVVTTSFQTDTLQAILNYNPDDDDWRIGEAMAEAYLTDYRNCEFPWPGWRDMKNPHSSLPGTDLVGFHHVDRNPCFAFAEVKTSQEKVWPPSVVKG